MYVCGTVTVETYSRCGTYNLWNNVGQKGLLTKQSKMVKPAEIQVDPCYSTQSEQLILTDVTNTAEIGIQTPKTTCSREKLLTQELQKYKKRMNRLSIDTSSKNLITGDQFKMFCEANFQPALANFIIEQLRCSRSGRRGIRYSEAYN